MDGEMISINLLNGDQLIFILLLGVNLSDILFKLQKNQFQYQTEKEQKGKSRDPWTMESRRSEGKGISRAMKIVW